MAHDFSHIYTKAELQAQLEQLGVPKGRVVVMHSSLRSIGNVEGGAQGLLDVLVAYFTRDGGLFCVPAHTWHNLRKDITLDMSSDDTALGAFATVALRDRRGLRSENPIHSLVVFGDRRNAEAFVEGELWLPSPTAPDSCHGKLCDMGGQILLVGVSQSSNTYLHAVDELLAIPNRMAEQPVEVAVKRANGEVIRRRMRLYHSDFISDISQRFPKYETAFRYHRCITDGFLGNAPVQLCDAAGMRDTVALLWKNSGGADPLEKGSPIPPRWYCQTER